MLNFQTHRISTRTIYLVLSFVAAIVLCTALWFENFLPAILLLAFGGLGCALLWTDKIYLAFFAILPFSIEVYFDNGFGTDLPTEPLLLFFSFWALLLTVSGRIQSRKLMMTPITIILMVHLSWICFSAIFAVYPVVSLKFLAAKIWYVLPLYVLFPHFIKTKDQTRKWANVLLAAVLISVVYVVINHGLTGFEFDEIGPSVSPIYRNHVNYAALLSIMVPICWFLIKTGDSKSRYIIALGIILFAIYFSYSRAALITVVILCAASVLLRWRLLGVSTLVAPVLGAVMLFYLSTGNRYLHLAPNYESTVAHAKFENLLEATYRGEDISTMERLHRWLAGFKMIREKPWTGFGPNNFYFNYKPYTINSFRTYVSDNSDRSGIHSYFLMTGAEQGIPGLLILVSIFITGILIGERKYHRAKSSYRKELIHMAILILVAVGCFNLINDLIEAVKVGAFFFIALAILNQRNSEGIKQKGANTI